MKYVVFLLVALVGTWATAQDGNDDSVAYVVELDDEMIAKLKQGFQLEEIVKPNIRGKISVVRVRYKPTPAGTSSSQTRDPNSNQNVSPGGSFGVGDQNSGAHRGSAGFDSRLSQLPSSPNRNTNRIDSNTFSQSADNLLPPRSNSMTGSPQTTGFGAGSNGNREPVGNSAATQQSVLNRNANFDSGNRDGRQNNDIWPFTQQNDFNRNGGSAQDQWNSPQSGQPINNSGGTFQPGGSQNRTNSFPTGTPPDGRYPAFPSNSTHPQPPQGNEFDTASGRQNFNRYDFNARPQANIAGPVYPYQSAQDQHQNAANGSGGTFPPWQRNDTQFQSDQFRTSEFAMYGPALPPIPSQTDFARRNLLAAGYNLPQVPNQVPSPTGNRVDHQNLLVQGNMVGGDDVSNGMVPSASDNRSTRPVNPRNPQAPLSNIDQANRFNGVLWFMLLCSIGLNIYLGWISRGFYIRYRELADELRETFSTAA